jgi:DNA repair protein RecO
MSHHIYTTKAILIKSTPIGEANRYYLLLTEDLGFIRATAQGVRLEKSKLKGHLQDFCQVKISLVKGKSIWRITSVETLDNTCFLYNDTKLSSIKNIFSLLLRLLHGEEKNEELFFSIQSFLSFLSKNDLSLDFIKNIETITVLRILYHLGYLKDNPDIINFIKDSMFSDEMLLIFNKYKRKAISDINQILKETHL